MDFFEVVQARYSVRAYQRHPVEPEKLQRLLRAIQLAPSAGNLQAYEVIVVRDEGRKRALAQAALEQWFIAEAPVVLIFFANPDRNRWRYGRRGEQLYCLQDATIACAYAQLAATALGLGSCWVGAFDDEAVRRLVKAPPPWRPIALLPLGYPAEGPEFRGRRPLDDLVHEETFHSRV